MSNLQFLGDAYQLEAPPQAPQEVEPEQPLSSLFGRAFKDTSVGYQIWNAFTNTEYEDDPNFEMTTDIFKEYAGDIPQEYRDDLIKSESLAELRQRSGEVRERLETRRLLAQHGYKGLAMTFGAAMLDPAYLFAIGATGGLGLIPKAGQMAGATQGAIRARAALRGLGVAATLDMPIEATRYVLDPMTDFNHMLFNVAAAGTLTSGLGAAFPTVTGFSSNWKQIQRQLDAEEMVKMNQGGIAVAAGAEPPKVKPHFPEDGPTPTSTKRDLTEFSQAELVAGAKSMGLPVTRKLDTGRSVPLSKGELMVEMQKSRPDMFSIGPEELPMVMPEGMSSEARRIFRDSSADTYAADVDIERLGPLGRAFAKIPGLGPVTLHAQASVNARVHAS